MTKQYKIAFMPGDGIGNDVLEASRAVLDIADFDVEYIPLDIGFKIFEAEGDALPERTIEALKECDAALFGAITSKPRTDPSVQKVEKQFGVRGMFKWIKQKWKKRRDRIDAKFEKQRKDVRDYISSDITDYDKSSGWIAVTEMKLNVLRRHRDLFKIDEYLIETIIE